MTSEQRGWLVSYGWAAILVVTIGFVSRTMVAQTDPESFEAQIASVKQHSALIVLRDASGQALIAVWPSMQGRVLTSSAEGSHGRSFGWINQALVASGKVQDHINAVGGEDRLWLGPEGGQFSVFFAKGAAFDLDHWYTPAPLDTEAFAVRNQTASMVDLTKTMELTNYSGNRFKLRVDRRVKILTSGDVWSHLGLRPISSVHVVGYESENHLTNVSENAWTESTGALSLWVLGQFNASPHTTIVLPIRNGSSSKLGPPVTRDYFGPVPDDRIKVTATDVFFRADAQFRSKLGLSPERATGVSGSYDADHHVLTIVQYTMPTQPALYVNSSWKMQADPFRGDVANCYNDGPPGEGKPQLGHFYELESSSPAGFLEPNKSIAHTHRTIHLVGAAAELDIVARADLGVSLEQVNAAFSQ